MNLQQTILNEAREEAKGPYLSQKDAVDDLVLKALEKQAEFFRHIASMGWKHEPLTDANEWYNDGAYEAELDLYNIWRQGK